VIAEWIDQAAADRGDASYLEDAAGGALTFAALRRVTAGWARCLDRAGVAPGAAVKSGLILRQWSPPSVVDIRH